MEPTLDQLRVLDAIARTGTFTGAAAELRRATSAVSYAIRNLEESLGVVLFDRSSRRAQLTDAGTLLLASARDVLERSTALAATAAQVRQGWEPRLMVIVDGIVPLPPLVRAVRSFAGLGAPTRIQLRTEFLGGVVERFWEEEADLMVTLGLEEENPSLRVLPIPDIEVLLVAEAGHPLCDQRQRKTRRELHDNIELVVADSARGESTVPRPVAIASPSRFELPDFYAKREALLEGVGYGWLPRHLADDPISGGRLAVVPYEEGFRRRFAPRLAHRRDVALGRAGQTFVSTLTGELQASTRRGRLR